MTQHDWSARRARASGCSSTATGITAPGPGGRARRGRLVPAALQRLARGLRVHAAEPALRRALVARLRHGRPRRRPGRADRRRGAASSVHRRARSLAAAPRRLTWPSFRATYRLQLGGELTFAARRRARARTWRELGVSHLYLSPSFAAREGSTHGYDVVDPTRISDALGGEAGFRALAAAAREAGLGIVLDIVPNHMATDDANPYWADPRAARATFFDLDPETGRHRRFFDIDHLAGVRQEDPEVFAETHRLALALVARGARRRAADRPSRRPRRPGRLPRARCATAAPRTSGWRRSSTPASRCATGRSRARSATSSSSTSRRCSSTRPARPRSRALWEELSGDARPFGEWAAEAKREQVARRRSRRTSSGCARLLAGRRRARGGARRAARLPHLHPRPARRAEDLRRAARGGARRVASRDGAAEPFVTRFQQTTPPVMAKGVEDTAFYRYVRLLALNDVGGDPGRFGRSASTPSTPATRERAARFPRNLLVCLDARHEALGRRARAARRAGRAWRRSGPPRCGAGASCARRCARGGAPDPVEEYTIFQTLAGRVADRARPARAPTWRRRCASASVTTSWIEPDDGARGSACSPTAARCYEHRPFLDDVRAVRGARRRRSASCTRCARPRCKLTVPGVPDVYQGDELVGALARRPRQPAPGRLGAAPRAARRAARRAPRR